MRRIKKQVLSSLKKGETYVSVEESVDMLRKVNIITPQQYKSFHSMLGGDDEMYDLCYTQVSHLFRNFWYKNSYHNRPLMVNLYVNDLKMPEEKKNILRKRVSKLKKVWTKKKVL